jgi:hypothetical protein
MRVFPNLNHLKMLALTYRLSYKIVVLNNPDSDKLSTIVVAASSDC